MLDIRNQNDTRLEQSDIEYLHLFEEDCDEMDKPAVAALMSPYPLLLKLQRLFPVLKKLVNANTSTW